MCADDRKVWSRELERDGKKATLQGLIDWMIVEPVQALVQLTTS